MRGGGDRSRRLVESVNRTDKELDHDTLAGLSSTPKCQWPQWAACSPRRGELLLPKDRARTTAPKVWHRASEGYLPVGESLCTPIGGQWGRLVGGSEAFCSTEHQDASA